MRKKTDLITEAHVQQTVKELLEADGWRAIRTDPVSDRSRGKGFGEVGMPDYLFIRYANLNIQGMHPANATIAQTRNEVMWIEFKRKGAKRTALQVNWHAVECSRGALVLIVDDIDEFTAWYKTSGLCRRILT